MANQITLCLDHQEIFWFMVLLKPTLLACRWPLLYCIKTFAAGADSSVCCFLLTGNNSQKLKQQILL